MGSCLDIPCKAERQDINAGINNADQVSQNGFFILQRGKSENSLSGLLNCYKVTIWLPGWVQDLAYKSTEASSGEDDVAQYKLLKISGWFFKCWYFQEPNIAYHLEIPWSC